MRAGLIAAIAAVLVTSVAAQASTTISQSMPPTATAAFNIAPIPRGQRCTLTPLANQPDQTDLSCSPMVLGSEEQLSTHLRWFGYGEHLSGGTLISPHCRSVAVASPLLQLGLTSSSQFLLKGSSLEQLLTPHCNRAI
jgi:hypothetical protein